MGFQGKFLDMIINLNKGTGAKLIINNFITKTVKLKRGIKQGDALSLFLFIAALEPLIQAIEKIPEIKGIKIPRGETEKEACYADDLNALIDDEQSLYPLMNLIENFGKASGLKVHPAGHPKCCTCLMSSNFNIDTENLPQNLKYVTHGIESLGTAVGSQEFVNNFTDKKIENLEREAIRMAETSTNYDERMVLANSILLPQINFHPQFHGLTHKQKKKIERIARTFCLRRTATRQQYEISTRDREHGGFGFPHLVKFTETMMLTHAMHYVKHRLSNSPLNSEMRLLHANIGSFICRKFDIPHIREIPAIYPMNYYYQRIKQFIEYYEITKEEIICGQVKLIKSRIRNGPTMMNPPLTVEPPFSVAPPITPNESFNQVISHGVITFLYKRRLGLLQLARFAESYGLENSSGNCVMCSSYRRETDRHVFLDCPTATRIWTEFGIAIGFPFTSSEILRLEIPNSRTNKIARTFVIALTLKKIWNERNRLKHSRRGNFDFQGFKRMIISSLKKQANYHLQFSGNEVKTQFQHTLRQLERTLVRQNNLS